VSNLGRSVSLSQQAWQHHVQLSIEYARRAESEQANIERYAQRTGLVGWQLDKDQRVIEWASTRNRYIQMSIMHSNIAAVLARPDIGTTEATFPRQW